MAGFQPLADVARGLPVPNHVGKVSRGVIKRRHLNSRIMRGGNKRIARSEARADDAEPVVTLRFQPVETAAHIDHALAHRIERASNVGGDGIVGAVDLRRTANIVIRHGEPQHRDAHPVEHAAEAVVGERIGIPVRQQNHGATSACRKPARVHQIIFGERRHHRRSEAQKLRMRAANFFLEARVGHFARAEDLNFAALQTKIRWLLIRVKVVAVLDDAIVEAREIFQQIACVLSRAFDLQATAVAARPVVLSNPGPSPADAPRGYCPPK